MSLFTSIAGSVKPVSGGGGATLVQQKVGGADSAITLTFAVSPTAGNSLIVCVAARQTNHPVNVTVIAQPGNIALTNAVSQAGSAVGSSIWYIHNIGSGLTSVELSDNGVGARISGNATEWSGLVNAAQEDTASNSGVASDTVTTGTVTPVSASNLVIGTGAWQPTNSYSTGPTNGFTRLTQFGSVNVFGEAAYLVQGATADASTGWGLSTTLNWASTIAVFGGA